MAVSSMNTNAVESSRCCWRIQRRRARATSARFCSLAYRLFFKADVVTLEEAPDGGAAALDPPLVHRRDDFLQRQIRLLLDQGQQPSRMFLQGRAASASWLAAARPPSNHSRSHLIAELTLIPKQSAASRRDTPASTASITRTGKSVE